MRQDRGMHRRDALRIVGPGCLAWALADRLRTGAALGAGRAGAPVQACILIFYYGGPSHHDTWDMKPNAPREVRGEFQPIATNVPGIRIGEHQPHSARVVDRLAIVRSASPDDQPQRRRVRDAQRPDARQGAPGAALHRPERPPLPRVDPQSAARRAAGIADLCRTSSCDAQRRRAAGPVPRLPRLGARAVPGQRATRTRPISGSTNWNCRGTCRWTGSTAARPCSDRSTASGPAPIVRTPCGRSSVSEEKALEFLRSPAVRRAFRLDPEDPRLRDRYGRGKHGQSVLLGAGWSSRACGSSRCSTTRSTASSPTGTPIKTCSTGSRTTSCRPPTRRSPH